MTPAIAYRLRDRFYECAIAGEVPQAAWCLSHLPGVDAMQCALNWAAMREYPDRGLQKWTAAMLLGLSMKAHQPLQLPGPGETTVNSDYHALGGTPL